MILFNSEGIYLTYKGKDVIDWKWPWNKGNSPSYALAPPGKPMCPDKVFGVSTEDVLSSFCKESLFEHTTYVVLTDIDVASKDKNFWLALPTSSRSAFIHDTVFMRCDTLNQALTLAANVPTSLAGSVWIYHEGQLRLWKEDDT